MKHIPYTAPVPADTTIRTGYYHGDLPGRTEPYLITIDTQSHAVDFR